MAAHVVVGMEWWAGAGEWFAYALGLFVAMRVAD